MPKPALTPLSEKISQISYTPAPFLRKKSEKNVIVFNKIQLNKKLQKNIFHQ